MAVASQSVAKGQAPICAMDRMCIRFRARCSRSQWWWRAEVIVTQRIYRAPTPSVPHWLLFNPTEIDMLGIPAPPGFIPSPPFEEAMFNGITGQPFEEATLNGMDEVIEAVSQVIDHHVPAPLNRG